MRIQAWKIFVVLLALMSSSHAAVTKFVVESRSPYPQDAKFEILAAISRGHSIRATPITASSPTSPWRIATPRAASPIPPPSG